MPRQRARYHREPSPSPSRSRTRLRESHQRRHKSVSPAPFEVCPKGYGFRKAHERVGGPARTKAGEIVERKGAHVEAACVKPSAWLIFIAEEIKRNPIRKESGETLIMRIRQLSKIYREMSQHEKDQLVERFLKRVQGKEAAEKETRERELSPTRKTRTHKRAHSGSYRAKYREIFD